MKVSKEEKGQKKRRWQRQKKEKQEKAAETVNGGGRGVGTSLSCTTDHLFEGVSSVIQQ